MKDIIDVGLKRRR